MIKALIVEDSPVAREFLTYILTSDPDIEVIGAARNGAEALALLKSHKPDVITMDIHMPIMDGFEATRRIMETTPTPIVVVSGSVGATEVASTFRALEAGALAVVRRPLGGNHEAFEKGAEELLRTIKLMSEIKVVRRISHANVNGKSSTGENLSAELGSVCETKKRTRLIVIGASTGGPPVLQEILSELPREFPVPILIVQHMAAGFSQGFAEWLSGASRFPVHMAMHDEVPLPGHAYLAPDEIHMGIDPGFRITLSDHPPEEGLRPSVSYLFRTTAETISPNAIGVLLTGMGRDGARELKYMKDKGSITIAQDEESAVVHGMPGEAIKLGATTHILPPRKIAALLDTLTKPPQGEQP